MVGPTQEIFHKVVAVEAGVMLRLQHWIVSVYDGYATEVLCAALTFLQQLVVNIIKVQATTIVQLKTILS